MSHLRPLQTSGTLGKEHGAWAHPDSRDNHAVCNSRTIVAPRRKQRQRIRPFGSLKAILCRGDKRTSRCWCESERGELGTPELPGTFLLSVPVSDPEWPCRAPGRLRQHCVRGACAPPEPRTRGGRRHASPTPLFCCLTPSSCLELSVAWSLFLFLEALQFDVDPPFAVFHELRLESCINGGSCKWLCK